MLTDHVCKSVLICPCIWRAICFIIKYRWFLSGVNLNDNRQTGYWWSTASRFNFNDRILLCGVFTPHWQLETCGIKDQGKYWQSGRPAGCPQPSHVHDNWPSFGVGHIKGFKCFDLKMPLESDRPAKCTWSPWTLISCPSASKWGLPFSSALQDQAGDTHLQGQSNGSASDPANPKFNRTAYYCLAMTAQAILPPDPPIGWLLWSSGFAWIISDEPSASSRFAFPSFKLTSEL